MRLLFTILSIFLFNASAFALDLEKACDTCDFFIIEKAENKNNCIEYNKYFFQGKKINKSYEEFCRYFVPNHKYAEFFKRYLPESNERYVVAPEHSDNSTVSFFYELVPKQKSIKEGKRANVEMIIDNERYYFQLQEVNNGTEISSCYNHIK